ncbi:MAG TPA: DUF502 domain-containing protein [Pseudolabrys sp.]|nr:DUF502 domain-containing protein [Pseudolabrys sp.]
MDVMQPQPGSALLKLLKATIVGGLLFLLPLILVVLLLGHAMKLAAKVAHPISQMVGLQSLLGPAGEEAFAILILVVISIIAGIVASTALGKALMRWTENSFLGGLPQYRLMKSMAEGLAQIETADGASPALINIEDGWQLGYSLEQFQNGWVAVFVPQSPTPMSGNIMYLPAQRVRPLDIPMMEAMGIVKSMGVGSAKALRQADLALP